MSAPAAMARVGQLEALLGTLEGGRPAPTPAPTGAPGGFSGVLQATTAGAATPVSPAGSDPASATAATGGAPASGGGLGGGAPSSYDALITTSARRHGVDPALLKGLIRQESGFNPSAHSGAGAVGLTQLMPGTAAALGVDPRDPAQSIEGGARYLRQQLDRFGGDPAKALAAYNAGPGAVARFGGVPPYAETQAYVQHVLAFARSYRASSPTPSLA